MSVAENAGNPASLIHPRNHTQEDSIPRRIDQSCEISNAEQFPEARKRFVFAIGIPHSLFEKLCKFDLANAYSILNADYKPLNLPVNRTRAKALDEGFFCGVGGLGQACWVAGFDLGAHGGALAEGDGWDAG